MKTKEELKQMTNDELVEYANQVQNDSDFWLKAYNKATHKLDLVTKKFKCFQDLVKSIVVFVDSDETD